MGQAVFSTNGHKVYLTNRGTNYLSVVNLDFSIGINVPIGNPDDLLTISPNLATDVIKIRCKPQDTRGKIISLFDIEGKKMLDLEVRKSEFDLDISELLDRVYFVKMQAGPKTAVKKLIVH